MPSIGLGIYKPSINVLLLSLLLLISPLKFVLFILLLLSFYPTGFLDLEKLLAFEINLWNVFRLYCTRYRAKCHGKIGHEENVA